MKKKIGISLMMMAIALLFAGCVTYPNNNDLAYGISSVGDRYESSLKEIIISIPNVNENSYQNLHIEITAMINPTQKTLTWTSDVRDVFRRLEPRIADRIITVVYEHLDDFPSSINTLRLYIAREAQKVFDDVFSKWKHSDEWKVELLVTSLYFTDVSVPMQTRRPMW